MKHAEKYYSKFKRTTQLGRSFFIFSILFILCGCASYQGKISESRSLIELGRFSEAIEKLKPLAEKVDDDQLVYLLDYGMALHLNGQFEESNKVFLKADKIADIQDYHSISNVTASVLLNEEQVQYKGDDYEKVLINAFLALNFLSLNDLDSALVEVRRLNNKLQKFKDEAGRNYQQSSFAKYISALIWESDRKYDDAYIAFAEAYKLDPSIPQIGKDLIRSARRAGRMDQYEKWKSEFKHVQEDPSWYDKKNGEIVLIHQIGWGPRKYPRPENQRFPKLYPVTSMIVNAEIKVIETNQSAKTEDLYSIERVAMQTLEDGYAQLVAKRVGGVVAKAVVADQIRQKNQMLGDIAYIAMLVSDRADLRQWSTLPKGFQIARISLAPGKYTVDLNSLGYGGSLSNTTRKTNVIVQSQKKTFLTLRSLK